MIGCEDISDAGSTPAVSTTRGLCVGLRVGNRRNPLPYGDVTVSTGCCEHSGGSEQASTLTAQTINANDNSFALPVAA